MGIRWFVRVTDSKDGTWSFYVRIRRFWFFNHITYSHSNLKSEQAAIEGALAFLDAMKVVK